MPPKIKGEPKQVPIVEDAFGNWLAGFIDGEGCFYITKDKTRLPWRARFSLALRADDRPILEECKARTGIGTLHNYKTPEGYLVTRWMVQAYWECDVLSSLLIKFPLRAKKKKDFEIWQRALTLQKGIKAGRLANNETVNEEMLQLKLELARVRQEGLECLKS